MNASDNIRQQMETYNDKENTSIKDSNVNIIALIVIIIQTQTGFIIGIAEQQ